MASTRASLKHTLETILLLIIALAPLSQTVALAEDSQKQRASQRHWDLVGLPLLSFTSDRGTGYGAYAAAFLRGDISPEQKAPYHLSLGGQFYQTTGGYAFHKLLFDIPNVAKSGIRLDLDSGYESWDSAWYFGLGNRLPRLRAEDVSDAYYTFKAESIWVVPNVRIPVNQTIWLFGGLVLRKTDIDVYSDTKLAADNPKGVLGGNLSQLQLGVMLDTRNREPDTQSGVFSEISFRFAHRVSGSDYSMWGFNTTHRQWHPLTQNKSLVLALRLGLDIQGGALPFFHQHILGGSQRVEVGGNVVLRGFPNGRFRGNITAYNNTELRWQFFSWTRERSTYAFLLVPFADLGRVWLQGEDDKLSHIHGSVGSGLRFVYNSVFVVRFDVASALEEFATPAEQNSVKERGFVMGIYAIVNHPF